MELARSAEGFDNLGVPLEAARSYLALGSLRRRIGHRKDARVSLDRARHIALECGSPRLVALADGEAARLGGRVHSDELTESELQVAKLAADGLRNKDIAADLHISTKTVEAHLGRAFRKLNVTGRTALARELEGRAGKQ
jgi:DNA-binding NarL/FixJ family response regulator